MTTKITPEERVCELEKELREALDQKLQFKKRIDDHYYIDKRYRQELESANKYISEQAISTAEYLRTLAWQANRIIVLENTIKDIDA